MAPLLAASLDSRHAAEDPETIPGVQYYYNAERPDGTAAEQLRFTVALLFPERRG